MGSRLPGKLLFQEKGSESYATDWSRDIASYDCFQVSEALHQTHWTPVGHLHNGVTCHLAHANRRFGGCSLCSLSCPFPPLSDMPLGHRSTSHRHICTKVLLAEGRESLFTEHCRDFEKSYRVLQTEVQKLKDEVQEMHRDLTMHHSLINTDTMDSILQRSLLIDQRIASLYSTVQTQRAVFEEMWDVTFQRVTSEQEIYEAQLHDLLQLRQENAYLTTIARQIGPYILSIAKVKERLEHRLQKPHSPEDDCMDTIKIKNV